MMISRQSHLLVLALILAAQAANAAGLVGRPLSMSTRAGDTKEAPDPAQEQQYRQQYQEFQKRLPGGTRAQSLGSGSYQLNTGPHVQSVGGGSYTVGSMKLQRLSDGSYLFSDGTHLKLLPDGSYSSSTGVLYRKLPDGSFAGTNGKTIRPTGDGSYNW